MKPIPASNGSVWHRRIRNWRRSGPPRSAPCRAPSRPIGCHAVRLARLPHRIEHRERVLADGRRSHSRARPYSRCATRRSARPRNRRSGRPRNGTTRVRSIRGCAGGVQMISLEDGRGCSVPARRYCAAGRVDERTQAWKPIFSACWRSQMPLKSSPPIQRKLFGAEPEHRAVVDHAAMLVAHCACRRPGPTDSLRMSRVRQYCSSASASGPVTSNLRNGDRSITAARSRQAQYSSIGPSLLKRDGSQ